MREVTPEEVNQWTPEFVAELRTAKYVKHINPETFQPVVDIYPDSGQPFRATLEVLADSKWGRFKDVG